jgi:hypothetical protein
MNSLGAELYGSIPIWEHATTRVQRHRAHGFRVEAVRKMGKESDSEHEPGSFDLDHHEAVEELRALPDAEIEWRHDMERQIRIGRAYRARLEHRQITPQGHRMEALTRSMNRLGWIVVLATIVGASMTAWTLLSGN